MKGTFSVSVVILSLKAFSLNASPTTFANSEDWARSLANENNLRHDPMPQPVSTLELALKIAQIQQKLELCDYTLATKSDLSRWKVHGSDQNALELVRVERETLAAKLILLKSEAEKLESESATPLTPLHLEPEFRF